MVNRARDVPSIPLMPVLNRTFNFMFTSLVDCFSFSPRDLCQMIGNLHPGITTSDIYPAMQSVRLNTVELWANQSGPGTSGGPSTVQAWVSRTLTNGNPVRLIGNMRQDVALAGSDVPAHTLLSSKSRANSILRQWFEQDDQDYLFTLSGPAGTILQINVSFTLNTYPPKSANSVVSNSYLSGGFGAPVLGLSALDTGNPTGSRIVVPVPVSSTTTGQIPLFL